MRWRLTKTYRLILFFIAITSSSIAQEMPVIPTPQEVRFRKGEFSFSPSSTIWYADGLENEAILLQRLLKNEHQLRVSIGKNDGVFVQRGDILLDVSLFVSKTLGNEGYILMVDDNKISLQARTPTGIFYGIQSLRQMVQSMQMQAVVITDNPVFRWRGFMLDEARYFKGEKVVKDLLDEMALLKMNIFHWHLTDDQGWRIEIKKYPKLTQTFNKTQTASKRKAGRKQASNLTGYYTQNQIRDIVQYATDRHITIVPEIEMPGHAGAAISCYNWLGASSKKKIAGAPDTTTGMYNVADARVVQFLHDVLDEIMALFPSQVIHIGGNETRYVRGKTQQDIYADAKKDSVQKLAEKQVAFANEVSRYLEQHGRYTMGWDELQGEPSRDTTTVDSSTNQQLSRKVILDFWSADHPAVIDAVSRGYYVVNSYKMFTSLDYDYKTSSLEKTYSFHPIPSDLQGRLAKKILGINAQMWSDSIPTVEKMNYFIYPRIAALAEVGWTNPQQKNFKNFVFNLSGYLKNRWKEKGIKLLPEQLYGVR